MRRASETRAVAWDAMRGGRYWPLLGGFIVLNLIQYALISLAFIVAAAIAAAFAFGMFGPELREVIDSASAAEGMMPDLCGLFAQGVSRMGPATFSLMFFVGGMLSLNAIVLPLVWCAGFMKWGIVSQSLDALRGSVKFDRAFCGFGHGWKLGWVMTVRELYVFLWSLLFIIPGILASFSYAMTDFIAVEHPDWSANRCIAESRRLMRGNRWRYFCMNLSFIGWWILVGIITMSGLSLVSYFLMPYVNEAQAAFYDELKANRPPELA